MDKNEEFKQIYKKFVDGMRWLNQRIQEGTVKEKDKEEFTAKVIEPMDTIWASLSDDEKDFWGRVQYGVGLFEGTIVSEDEVKERHKAEDKKRTKQNRWRRYFRSY
jgi:hypothetical protein